MVGSMVEGGRVLVYWYGPGLASADLSVVFFQTDQAFRLA